jgi:GT2 family glycosyltransferase
VDDGSTDDTARIAAHYPAVRIIHQQNLGLSAARNTGIAAAMGEIVAFTDSDCRADEDWLYYLIGDLLRSDACAIGGHNFPPPEDQWVAGCVAVSPGGPAHVMLDDRTAEHVPGCNMAFWKWALADIEGFDAQFRAAGDDVDVCWRLIEHGRQIAFSHAGFVWHYRRNTGPAYLKQQRGYGVAEALLRHKHPEYFNTLGGMRWRGRIYSPSRMAGLFGRFVIYHGIFGSGLFQTLYTPEPVGLLGLLTSLEWHVLFTLGGVLLASIWHALWPLPALTALASLSVAALAAMKVRLPPKHRRFLARPLIAALYLLQPIVRGWPRYARRLHRREAPLAARDTVRTMAHSYKRVNRAATVHYWNEVGIERFSFLQTLLELLDRDRWQARPDSGWDEYDVTIYGDRFSKAEVKTVCENHGGNKRLLRGHLRSSWTLLGKMTFWIVTGGALLFVGLSNYQVWALPVLALVPLIAAYLHLRARRTLRLGIALLDLTGQELKLAKLDAPKKFVKAD